ncbi:MAG: RagB/SusD family nutrient uptake outer membrane protein [Gracilimonas sp.]
MNKNIYLKIVTIVLIVGFYGCDVFDPDPISDPNNPSVDEVILNANANQLQNLVTGLEQRNRTSTVGAADFTGSFGREFYPMYTSDPRFMAQWLGLADGASAETDRSFYQSGQVWVTPYLTVKQANVLIEAIGNTDQVNQEQKNGYLGVAKTFKAFAYIIPLLTQSEESGIRIDVEEERDPGPFVAFDDAIVQIRALLDEASTDLNDAGSEFNFSLTSGLESFNTPAAFIQLNRAIDARLAIYEGDFAGALESLEEAEPFFELDSGEDVMNKGAYFVYSGPPGQFNPYYYPPNAETNQILMVHPSMVDDAEADDERVDAKFFERDESVSIVSQGTTFSSLYQDNRFMAEANTSPFPWLRNEELILIYAEANLRQDTPNLVEAVSAINLVRDTWGLPDFVSADPAAITDQLLYERRYSLWGEFGHRWLDAKRFDRLDDLPTDGGTIYEYLARPLSEVNWDDFSGN